MSKHQTPLDYMVEGFCWSIFDGITERGTVWLEEYDLPYNISSLSLDTQKRARAYCELFLARLGKTNLDMAYSSAPPPVKVNARKRCKVFWDGLGSALCEEFCFWPICFWPMEINYHVFDGPRGHPSAKYVPTEEYISARLAVLNGHWRGLPGFCCCVREPGYNECLLRAIPYIVPEFDWDNPPYFDVRDGYIYPRWTVSDW